jgi:PBP1b-binding outer membrane lipoprotein LpoB
MKYLILITMLLTGCAAAQRPKVTTPAPALTATKQATHDAKDFLSRETGTNTEINQELDALEAELDTP